MSEERDLSEGQNPSEPLRSAAADSSAEMARPEAAPADLTTSADEAQLGTALNSTERAFEQLRQALEGLASRGARSTAAGVKSEILRISSGGFHESALGFTSFRAFLEAAADAGVVDLELPQPGSGQDVTVTLPGQQPAAIARPSTRSSRRRIRPDLWTAFVDWNQSFVRLWDRNVERAVILSKAAQPGEPPTIARLRERYGRRPNDFVAIKPITQEEQLGWMRAFADSVAAEAPDLKACLSAERPAASFAQALRGDPALSQAWRDQLSSLVTEVIDAWAAEHGLQINLTEAPFSPTAVTGTHRRAADLAEHYAHDQRPTSEESALRAQLLAVLAELSTDELLQIRVPIVYALRP